MQAFSGYDDVKVNNYDYERLNLGGHVVKILEVAINKFSNSDGKEFENLELKIDIAEPDEQAGFYQRKFTEDAKADALKAKWKGYFKVSIPKDDSSDTVKSIFKGFITSIEESNPGYKWTWDETTLAGKIFGGVFGIEEFVSNIDGRTIAMTKCRFARGVEKIAEAKIPKVKLADKTLMDYEEYIEKKKNEEKTTENNSSVEESMFDNADVDSLPF